MSRPGTACPTTMDGVVGKLLAPNLTIFADDRFRSSLMLHMVLAQTTLASA